MTLRTLLSSLIVFGFNFGFSQLVTIPNPLPSPTCGSSLSSRLPSYYDDWMSKKSWSASIYNKSYFTGNVSISSIKYFVDCSVSSGTNCNYGIANNQTIYLGHINSTVFNNGNRPDSDVDIQDLTQVYSGTVQWVEAPVASGGIWTTINFDTPFNYNQSKHLVVYFVNEHGGSLAGAFLCGNPGKIVDAQGGSGTQHSKYANTTGSTLPNTTNYFSNQVPIVRFQTGVPLPVELSFFTVKEQNGFAVLSWQTISERNNDRFEVEKSNDLKDWKKVGSISGNGNSMEKINYSFSDSEKIKAIQYYRICQIDFDGYRNYSPIKSISNVDEKIEFYPNPTSGILMIKKEYISSEKIKIFNQFGKEIQGSISIEKLSSSELKIDLSQLTNGVYFVKISGQIKKIIICK